MPNQFDGATGIAAKQADEEKAPDKKKCKWSNCEGHEKDLDAEYNPKGTGNVSRQGQKLRDTLHGKNLEPWAKGGHGETNVRKMYLDQRKDGTITLKAETHPYRVEAHHILPVEQLDSTSTLKDNAVLAGWDINGVSNGMLLPKDEADVALHLLQQHNGSHPGAYTSPIADLLDDIENAYAEVCQGKEDVALQLALAEQLKQASVFVQTRILGIRQQASGVEFWGLHLNSLSVYTSAVRTLEDRRQRYAEQQRQQILNNTQRKALKGV